MRHTIFGGGFASISGGAFLSVLICDLKHNGRWFCSIKRNEPDVLSSSRVQGISRPIIDFYRAQKLKTRPHILR